MKEKCIVGIDIGGTFVRAGVVDSNNTIVLGKTVKSAELFSRDDPSKSLITWLGQLIEESGCSIRAISAGVPSTLNRERTIVLSTPNIHSLDNVPVARLISEAFSVPCFLEKDSYMLLYYDLYKYQISTDQILIGIYLGTGIGNAILISGQPLIGKNGVACELGHIPCVEKSGRCACGNDGCMEVFASGKALERLCAKYYPDTPIEDVFAEHADENVLRRFIDSLSIPVATEVNIFDPDCVVIGGGLPAMRSFPKVWFTTCILAHTRKPFPAKNLRIIYSTASRENGVIGAAIYAQKRMEVY